MKTAVVVGGGIAGILSAILLKKKFEEVYLIEKGKTLGGLLKSYRNQDGIEFDYGTHFLRETGIPQLDAILFEKINPETWLTLNFLKAGNFFQSQLNEKSPFINSTFLSEELYHKGMIQLLNCVEPKTNYENLEEQLNDIFGTVFLDHIFKPVFKKFFNNELHKLAPDANRLLLPAKLIGFTPEASRELKKSSIIDSKLAFHSYKEGLSGVKNYYPKRGGIIQWVEGLQQKLQEINVKVLTNSSVKSIQYSNTHLDTIVLDDNTSLKCNQLVWTIPLFLYIKAHGLTFPCSILPPKRLVTSLHHFVLDQPFLTDLYYFTCYDPQLITFRVTLYPNVQQTYLDSTQYHLTAEVLSTQKTDLEKTSIKVFEELIQMGVIPASSRVLTQHSEIIQEGFPVPTIQFVNGMKSQLEFVKKHASNTLFLGRSTGASWLMNEVLSETYLTIEGQI